MPVPDLSGKCVLVYTTNVKTSHALFIDNPRFEEQAGKMFLVGRIADVSGKSNWTRVTTGRNCLGRRRELRHF